MTARIITQWTFQGRDWITSIDTVMNRYVLVGSRNGDVDILSWHGVPLTRTHLESWVGAICTIATTQPEHAHSSEMIIRFFCGTKAGVIRCIQATCRSDNQVDLCEVFAKQTTSTIRSLTSLNVGTDHGGLWVAAGSEDRTVHLFRFSSPDDLVSPEYLQLQTNGWIRAVAFCREPTTQQFLVVAGSGDKHLHFFDLHGTRYHRLFLDSKVHSVLSDPRSSLIYCTSDARLLYIIVPRDNNTYEVQQAIPLPHRAIQLAFDSDSCERVLIATEDRSVYLFDVLQQKLVGRLPVRGRIVSMRAASTPQTHLLLVGHGARTLECLAHRGLDPIPKTIAADCPGYAFGFQATALSQVATLFFVGPKEARQRIGIGRFLHIASLFPGARRVCMVATDEGNVVILSLDPEPTRVLATLPREGKYRVWSVYGAWRSPGCLRVLVATSESRLRTYDVLFTEDGTAISVPEESTIELSDWPREIRPFDLVSPGDEAGLVVACEDGELRTMGQETHTWDVGRNLRTACARTTERGLEILTGSDSNCASVYRDGVEEWRFQTEDRVREVVIDHSDYIAVSEDRYLYVLNHEGMLQHRYRFPHRALCVDLYEPRSAARRFVVGCGDGYVYVVTADGFVEEAFEFPDRIRDLKVLASTERVVVACEDEHVYIARMSGTFLRETYHGRQHEVIAQRVNDLLLDARERGPIAFADASFDERMLLLAVLQYWHRGGNGEFLVSLLDSVGQGMANGEAYLERNLKQIYTYARALVLIAATVDFAVGRSRIADFMQNHGSNPYASHALLAAAADVDLPQIMTVEPELVGRAVLEVIVDAMPLSDPWLAEEALVKLHDAGHLGLGRDGLHRSFETVRLPFRKLELITREACECSVAKVRASDFARFVGNLGRIKLRGEHAPDLESLLEGVRNLDVELRSELLRLLQLFGGRGLWSSDSLREVAKFWISSDDVWELVRKAVMPDHEGGRRRHRLEPEVLRQDPVLSGREYLFILLMIGFEAAMEPG